MATLHQCLFKERQSGKVKGEALFSFGYVKLYPDVPNKLAHS